MIKLAMKPVGWRYESYRHSLAAKGVRTRQGYFSRKYFAEQAYSPEMMADAEEVRRKSQGKDAPKEGVRYTSITGEEEALRKLESAYGIRTAGAAAKELAAERLIESEAGRRVREASTVMKISDQIAAGQFDKVVVEDEFGNLTEKSFGDALRSLPPMEYKAAVSQIRRKVTELARAGVVTSISDVPESVRSYVASDPSTVSLIKSYAEDLKDVQRSSFLGRAANTAGTLAVSAVAGGEVLARAGARGVQGAYQELQQQGPGFFGNPELQVETPGVKNIFFEGYRPGRFSPTSTLPSQGEVQRLMGLEGSGLFGGAAAGPRPLTQNEFVQKEIDELYGARGGLSKVDFEPYARGQKAFKEGNREELLKAITDLEAQEQVIADRWMLAEQSRAQVMKPENRALAYAEQEKSFLKGLLTGNMVGGGGDVIEDRTRKIGEVKRRLKEARDELFTRRKMLRYDLQRMDSVVTPKSDAPKKVRVLRDEERGPRWLSVPRQVNPRDVLQDVFVTKRVREDLSQEV